MNRRKSFIAISFTALATPFFARASLAAMAQEAGRIPRVGLIRPEHPGDAGGERLVEAFRQGLRELGYREGRNIAFELRWLEGKLERSPVVVAELVRLKVDCIVTPGTVTTRAAQKATTTIPIIMANSSDPVADGFIASLPRPGGNITGLSSVLRELGGKQLELLKQVVPSASRVAVLWNPDNPGHALREREIESAARALGLVCQPLKVSAANNFDAAFQAATAERADGLIAMSDVLFQNHRSRIVALAAKHRLPAMYSEHEYVTAGGLMVYGSNLADQYRRAASYVHKIIKGAKPASLPVEQPTKFELVINVKTAKALGLTLPPSLLRRADEVIQR